MVGFYGSESVTKMASLRSETVHGPIVGRVSEKCEPFLEYLKHPSKIEGSPKYLKCDGACLSEVKRNIKIFIFKNSNSFKNKKGRRCIFSAANVMSKKFCYF